MAITIINAELETRLYQLGRRQLIPVSKTKIAEAILSAAVSDERGGPIDKWLGNVRQFIDHLNQYSRSPEVPQAEASKEPDDPSNPHRHDP